MCAHHVAVSIRSYGGRESVHAHDFHQIVLPVLGAMSLEVGGAAGSLACGSGAVIVGGTAHRFRALGENRFVVLDVSPSALLPDAIVDRAAASPFFAIDEPLGHLARYLSCEAAATGFDDAAAHHAIALLARSIGRRLSGPRARGGPISRAIKVLHARYAEPLTVRDLARSAGMGLSRFHDRFRREIGHTPADCLAGIRLDRAARLLRDTGLSIAEIALAVGYSDQSALTRSFRRRRGTTPAEVRRGGLLAAPLSRRAP